MLKIATGQEDPTAGDVLVAGHSSRTARGAAQRAMGLCPQFDTLCEALTVRENLELFARLKVETELGAGLD